MTTTIDQHRDRFLRDVAQHRMTIVRNEGINRHLRFRNPESSCYWFDLVTWPGVLCINGDCGSYMFSRTSDMFTFFSTTPGNADALPINPEYWSGKVVAQDRDGVRKFSGDKFRAEVKGYYDDHFAEEIAADASMRAEASEDEPLTEAELAAINERARLRAEIWDRIDNEILDYCGNFEYEAMRSISEFNHNDVFSFTDWEFDAKEWTFRFIWCLHAIVYGINAFTLAQLAEAAPAPEAEATHG